MARISLRDHDLGCRAGGTFRAEQARCRGEGVPFLALGRFRLTPGAATMHHVAGSYKVLRASDAVWQRTERRGVLQSAV
jgi:hypothetical protein